MQADIWGHMKFSLIQVISITEAAPPNLLSVTLPAVDESQSPATNCDGCSATSSKLPTSQPLACVSLHCRPRRSTLEERDGCDMRSADQSLAGKHLFTHDLLQMKNEMQAPSLRVTRKTLDKRDTLPTRPA